MAQPHKKARQQLDEIKKRLFENCRPLSSPLPPYVLFLSEGTMSDRAIVHCFSGNCADKLWESVVCQLANRVVQKLSSTSNLEGTASLNGGIKFEVITECHSMPIERLKKAITDTKRNYMRIGVALDNDFQYVLTESEIQANALFYAGPKEANGKWNDKNIIHFMNHKYKNNEYSLPEKCDPVNVFMTSAVFLSDDNNIYNLYSKGPGTGRRVLSKDQENNRLDHIICHVTQKASDYLCDQLNESGYMRYGYFPVFNRLIPGSNSLRQVCATLALLESFQHQKKLTHLKSARLSLDYLSNRKVKSVRENGNCQSFLTDARNEIKLGGCGLLLLALVNYKEVTGSTKHDELIQNLANGIMTRFPITNDGLPVHVLNADDLSVKEEFRTVYYEGEAMFALASYYQTFNCAKTFEYLTSAFTSLIALKRWKTRDHWLAYACDKMHEVTGEYRYAELAAKNIHGYLDFISKRETAFPTLLELCTATERLANRYGEDEFFKLAGCTVEEFRLATQKRASRLLDAYFWPEFAMHFKSPETIQSSFFIRHHAFRVRVDDVGHFILGLIAYEKTLGKNREQIAC